MAGSPRPSRERAAQGLTWAVRGLAGFLVLLLLMVVVLLAFALLYDLPSPSVFQEAQLENSLSAFSLVLLALGVASGLAFAVGLAGLYGPRHELGPVHAASAGETTLWLAVTLVLSGATIFVPSLTGPLLAFPGIGYAPPSWSWSLSVMVAGLRAIFAGLTLYYAVQGLAQEDARVRLLLAMTLGVVGAITWSGLAAYAAAVGEMSMESLLPFLAGIVGGLGTSAISLGLFIAVYREVRRELVAASPAPT